jgi:cation diffusion facilitator CzcD-associated flavoprotein CzcO
MSKYCVIGAGPAGLASMKTLVDAGLDFDCFERTQDGGGHPWIVQFLRLFPSGETMTFSFV